MRGALRILIAFTLLTVAIIEAAAWMKRNRSDLPWTELDLTAKPGRFTPAKIAGLGDDAPRCRALLAVAGNLSQPAPSRRVSETCGYEDGTRLALGIAPSPSGLVTSCPVAAALTIWEREAQAAAQRLLGTQIRRFVHAGSFSCRRLYGREEGPWSEHATADAVDVLGFELADGRRLSVLRDWSNPGPEGAFLKAVRDAACGSFSTVLSPDYNQAHRDHLHFDTADRGPGGWRACR